MSHISKTILYPIPTEWRGDDQDDDAVGIITYRGPAKLLVWFRLDENGVRTNEICDIHDADDPCLVGRPRPLDIVEVELDAEQYPLNAAGLKNDCIDPSRCIPVEVGPEDRFEPATLRDPCHLTEAYDMGSFGTYDDETGTWVKPRFKPYDPEDRSFGWDWVRAERDHLLKSSDSKIAPDAPESVTAPWKKYRQELRDLPAAWAGVGTETRLIMWPLDPDERQHALEEPDNPDGAHPKHLFRP